MGCIHIKAPSIAPLQIKRRSDLSRFHQISLYLAHAEILISEWKCLSFMQWTQSRTTLLSSFPPSLTTSPPQRPLLASSLLLHTLIFTPFILFILSSHNDHWQKMPPTCSRTGRMAKLKYTGNIPDAQGIHLAWVWHFNLKQMYVKAFLGEPLWTGDGSISQEIWAPFPSPNKGHFLSPDFSSGHNFASPKPTYLSNVSKAPDLLEFHNYQRTKNCSNWSLNNQTNKVGSCY